MGHLPAADVVIDYDLTTILLMQAIYPRNMAKTEILNETRIQI